MGVGLLAPIVGGGTPTSDDTNWNGEVPFVTPPDLNGLDGQLVTEWGRSITEIGTPGSSVIDGGVLLSCRAPVGHVGTVDQKVAFNQGCKALVMTDPADARYLAYTLVAGREALNALANGTTFMELSARNLASFKVPWPVLDDRRRIVDYLDRETAEIDAMDAELDRLVETLRERRDAVWASGMDQALSAGRSVKLGMLIASIVDGPFGSSLTSSHYSHEGARVIRLGNIGVNTFRNDDKAFIAQSYADKLAAHEVVEGDVVIAGLGDENMPLGRAAVVPSIGPAIVKADCYRVRPNELVTSNYLAWALSSPQSRAQFKTLSRGATRERLNTRVVQDLRMPLIPLAAQTELLREFHELSARIDDMIADAQRLKSLLAERRSTLITDVVTGKKEVPA